MFRFYADPKKTGWLGWFEDANGTAIAFVDLSRKVHFMFKILGEPQTK